jgi:succinoglycan biosynthesis transport protein ExoP
MFEPILATLNRHRWLASMAFLIPFSGAAALAMALPNLYRATATILVQRDQDPVAAAAALPADVETRLQTIREEVMSRKRLDVMAERFGLYPELGQRAPREMIIDRMRKDIQIQLKGPEQGAAPAGTIAFSLSVRGVDRVLTASVANSLAESYVEENLAIRRRQAKAAADALGAQLTEVRARLDEQEVSIGRYQAAHNGELPQQLAVNLARMQQLETQLQLTRESRMRAMDRRDFAGRQVAAPYDPESNREATATRLTRMRQELADLKTTYSDKYPDVARLRNEISALESRQKTASPGMAAPRPKPALDDDMRTMESEEDRLRRQIGAFSARVDRAPQREQEFAQLSRDYATTKELYGSLLKKYQEATIADDMERDNKGRQLRILDSAIAPPEPFAPKRSRLMLFGLMASLAFAAGAVALAEKIDTSFHTVDDLRSFTRVPVLVSIPPLRTRAARWRGRRLFAWMTLVTVTGIVLLAAAAWSVAHGNIALVQMLAQGSAS